MSTIDLARIFEEARSYLVALGDLDEDEPVPREELVEQAKANGYDEREVREALRDTDDLVAARGSTDLLRLAEGEVETPEPPEPADMEPRGAGSEADDPQGETDETPEEKAVEALRDVLRFYNARVDDTITDHTGEGDHPERPTTAREYFTDVRGWDDHTVDDLLLGWAPPDHSDQLVAYLHDRGHDREAILATGAVGETESGGFYTTFTGRYVLPYYDANGDPAYAIARVTGGDGGGAKGYGGHPRDYQAGKYAKLRHTDDRVPFDEPIYGLDTLDEGAHVVVAEGIADAITARELGYSVLSPVAKEFKEAHYEPLANALDDHGVGRVTIVADADSIRNDDTDEDDPETIGEAVSRALSPVGAGLAGSLRTATKLGDRTEADIRVTAPPAPAALENDLDEFVNGPWNGDLDALLASAKPAETYAEYEAATAGSSSTTDDEERNSEGAERSGDGSSALWDLDLSDLESLEDGERTKNPFSHTGDSETYFVARRQTGGDVIAKDYKAKGGGQTYNALTGLLVDAGKRRRDDPEGSLSDAEVFHAWRQAKVRNDLAEDDPVPYRAIVGIAVEDELVAEEDLVERDPDTGEVADEDSEDTYQALPSGTYNDVLDHIREEYDIEPGREPATGRDADEDDDGEAYDDDPREAAVTVDPRRAWDAAGRVEPSDLDDDRLTAGEGDAFACPDCSADVDVVRAVAVAEGLVGACDDALDTEYPEAYTLAREEYGAPLPEYYTTTDAIAEFDAVLDVIGEVSFFHLDTDALATEVTATGDDVNGEAVRALNPSWRESKSEESVIVFDSGTIWDADTRRVVDVLRFVALDSGLLEDPREALEGSDFTEAYGLARTEYGAPLPRWEPAEDGTREITPQLPPSDELVDARDVEGVDPDALEAAREDVEALIADATADDDTPTVVTALPATGKTTGTVKTAQTRALSYLAPRKELQAQALDKADRWGVDAEVLPVFSEERVRPEVLDAAVSHVREAGKGRLRDRWAILFSAFDGFDEEDAEELDPTDIFEEDDDSVDDVDLDRPTCETAEGDHGVAWALAVHVARRLGYTPREIHQQAHGLFGAPLPCTAGEDGHDGSNCEYGAGWDRVTDADATPDLLVGSYVHAHVESVRTEYTPGARERVDKAPRAVVLDEFPGEAFVRDFGDEAEDFATWLARCLRDGVEDRRDMLEADLGADEFVTSWLEGREGDDIVTAGLARVGDHLNARNDAAEILDEVERRALEAIGLAEPLEAVVDGDTDAATAFDALDEAIDAVDPEQPASGLANWADDAVRAPLARATLSGSYEPTPDTVDTDELGIGGDLEALVEAAVEAARERRDGAVEAVEAAVTALRGGREGCRRLAAWATDGYAHPDAHHLLGAVVEEDPTRIQTSSWAFDPDATDGTVLDVVDTGERARTVLDRNGHGARIHTPPSRTSGGGDDAALVGLDATGRAELWTNALGEEVVTADIHDTPEERAAFLEDALDLRVLQAADRPRPYEGDPTTKDTDGDVALLEAIAEEYSGLQAPRERGDDPVAVGKPAAITTKGVRGVLENDTRLDDVVAEWENYGNLTGDNHLGDHRLAAILGSQHYGDHAIERFCALAGEEVDTERRGGRGADLDYGSGLANAYLQHMREDQTMQAILRFTRGDSGATVVARTSALREDLPVVGDAQVVETWSDTATEVARQYRRLGGEFTIGDVADSVDVTRRQVRRILAELADAGYIHRVDGGSGVANVYEPADTPGAGEVELPQRETAEPGRSAHNQYYTWNVRVFGGETAPDTAADTAPPRQRGAPPAPTAVDTGDPPA